MDNAGKENNFTAVLVFWVIVLSCINSIQSIPYINITVTVSAYTVIYTRNIVLSHDEFSRFYLSLCKNSTQRTEINNIPGSLQTFPFPADTDVSIYSKYFFCGISWTNSELFVCSKQLNTCISDLKLFFINNVSDMCRNVCIYFYDVENQDISIVYFVNDSLYNKDQCESNNVNNQTQHSSIFTPSISLTTSGASNITFKSSSLINPTSEAAINSFTKALYNNSTIVTDLRAAHSAESNNNKTNIIIGCCVVGGILILIILVLILFKRKLHIRKTNNAQSDHTYFNTNNNGDLHSGKRQQNPITLTKTFTSEEANPNLDSAYTYVDRIDDLNKIKEETITDEGNDNAGYIEMTADNKSPNAYSRLEYNATDLPNVYNSPEVYANANEEIKTNSLSDTRVQSEHSYSNMKAGSLPKGSYTNENVV